MSKLRHDNILPLLGIITGLDGTVSIVTEWMARGNAHDYVQDTDVDPRPLVSGIHLATSAVCSCNQILDVAKGIFYLHNHTLGTIIHGDLKGVSLLVFW